MKLITIYALFDPRLPEYVRYVGATGNLDNRLKTHNGNGLNDSTEAKRLWVKLLKENGLNVGCRILEKVPEDQAANRESYWIMQYQSPFLLNVSVKPEVREQFRDPEEGLVKKVQDFERNIITEALVKCKWKKAPAAAMLQISRPTLYDKMDKLKIKHP